MAIDPVDGYGQITASNAKEIYTAYRKGDVELNAAQKKKTESFLSSEDLDEIDYDSGVANKDGQEQLGDDLKNAESHDGQGGNAAASSVVASGAIGDLVFGPMIAETASKSDSLSTICWTALAGGAVMAGSGASALAAALMFDNGLNDRIECKNNASSTNQVLDDNKDVLEQSMESMNADVETYQEQSDEYTQNVNDATANSADLEAQIADAEAAGDIDGAKKLKDELKRIQENGFENELEGMEETRAMLDEYQYANDVAGGVSQGGQTITDFLKEGTALGVIGTINSVALAAATLITAISSGKAIASGVLPWEKPVAIAANILFMVGFALLGAGTGIMIKKTVNEFECGSAGNEMQDHVSDLDDMMSQQEGYMETTTEDYDKTDEESQENQDKAKEAADKANKNRQGGVGGIKNKPGGKEAPTQQPTTTTTSSSSSSGSSSNPFG